MKTKQVTLAFMHYHQSCLRLLSPSTTENDCVETICSFFDNTEIEKYFSFILFIYKKITSLVD